MIAAAELEFWFVWLGFLVLAVSVSLTDRQARAWRRAMRHRVESLEASATHADNTRREILDLFKTLNEGTRAAMRAVEALNERSRVGVVAGAGVQRVGENLQRLAELTTGMQARIRALEVRNVRKN